MLEPGTIIDRYIVEEKLGEGGMAAVYRVRHNTLGSRFALKVLTIHSVEVRRRLMQEGKVQAALRHPNVVAVTDVLDVNGSPGLLMEFIQGPALDHWLYNYSPTLEEALTVFRGIVCGIGEAHSQGMIHRDLKPANILLHTDQRGVHPKVADFGLVKVNEQNDLKATRAGSTMGTPAYMAPEQIRDASSVDRRADLYSLGVILYELVCGRAPFVDEDVIELFTKVGAGQYTPPRDLNPALPQTIVDCIEALMEVSTAHRLTDCASILEMLEGAPRDTFTNVVPRDGEADLARPRPMPRHPGKTSIEPESPGAAMAQRYVKDLVTIQPVPASPSFSEDGAQTIGLNLDLRPIPATTPEQPARLASRGLLATLFIGGAAILGTLLLLIGVGTTATFMLRDTTPTSTPDPSDRPTISDVPTEVPTPTEAPAPLEPTAPPVPSEPVTSTDVPVPAPKPPPKPTDAPVPAAPVKPVPPTPVPVPEAPVQTGSFRYSGDSGTQAVVLVRGSQRYGVGDAIPAGTYVVHARFESYDMRAYNSVTIDAGEVAQLHCNSTALRCVQR